MSGVQKASPLHQQLRLATRSAHQSLDQHVLLRTLIRPELSREDYAQAMAALYGVHAAMEDQISSNISRHAVPFDFSVRRKVRALAADLQELGQTPIPLSQPMPETETLHQLIGHLYVIEGSMLGGQYIANKISHRLPCRFYSIYGTETALRWEEFWQFADSTSSPDQYDLITEAAVTLFEAIRLHLDVARQHLV